MDRRAESPEQPDGPPSAAQHRALAGLLLGLWLLLGAALPYAAVHDNRSGRDFASYHYAVQAALDGGDPYDVAGLGARSAAEGTRREVHPFFYPPPALLGLLWDQGLSLKQAYRLWFWGGQLAALGAAAALWRWLRAPIWLPPALLLALSPLHDSAKMGQINVYVLLLAVLGLWRGSGLLVGAAGMAKMSPALFLVGWAATGRWRAALAAAGAAVGLSLLTLPLVGIDAQLRFYTEILPGFASGDYHGLRVPITLPANHSIPDLLNQLWPGPSRHRLDPLAQRLSGLISLGLLAACAAAGRRWRGPDDGLQQGLLAGALTVVMTLTPVYTYEHHLSFLLLPAAAALTACLPASTPRDRRALALCLVALAPVCLPLTWLRALQDGLTGGGEGPGLLSGGPAGAVRWLLQESKPAGAALLGLVCVERLAARAADSAQAPR